MKFKQFLKLNEGIDTKRSSLEKIQQMTGKKFVEFLTKIKPYIDKGKIDFDKLNVTEKVDGQSFRLSYYKGNIGAESSYSGLQTDPNYFKKPFGTPFKRVLEYSQKKLNNFLSKIAKKYGDYKVCGELLYIEDKIANDDGDGTVTIVATKYDLKKLGKIATFIMFNEMKWDETNNTFIKSSSNKIINELTKLSNNDIKFVSTDTIKWSGKMDIEYNMSSEKIENILDNPDILLKDRELLKKVQEEFVNAFQKIIKSKGSVFGVSSSVVEGIVLDIEDFGLVGASNPEWGLLKKIIFRYEIILDNLQKEFFKDLCGFLTKKKLKEYMEKNPNDLSEKLSKVLPIYKQKVKEVESKYKADKSDIPKSMIKSKDESLEYYFHRIQKIKDIKTLSQYINGEI
jgi:hypothetical protein